MKLRVAGARASGAGYPNGEATLRVLREQAAVDVIDCGTRLPDSLHLWRLATAPPLAKAIGVARLFLLNLASVGRIICPRQHKASIVYVPYPAMFFLWLLSWLPRRQRPCCIADAYISVWDSMCRDRGSRDTDDSLTSRALRWFEGRALCAADLVLVDTEANQRQMAADFALNPVRVKSVPLAIDEAMFLSIPPTIADVRRRVRVLFVGTMIPLHGIDVVLAAARALRSDPRVEFRLVGEGQQAGRIEEALAGYAPERFTWQRGWHDLAAIAREIQQADICLGVFGGDGKAARVLPFKLYMYLAAGRAVISQAALSVPAGAPRPPIEGVEPVSADALAGAIVRLIDDPKRRRSLELASRDYYLRWLSHARLRALWSDLALDAARARPD